MTKHNALLIAAVLAAAAARSPGQATQPAPKELSRVTPAVRAYRLASQAGVNISTRQLVRPRMGLLGDDLFDEIFPGPMARAVPVQSIGSGFLIHPDGFLITNAHVVGRAQEINVTLADKTSHAAAIISVDSAHDLAVLRIRPPDKRLLPYLPLGRSDDLMVGETVFAIGNPLGLANTLTSGLVSALDRTLEFRGDVSYAGLVQIDAPINPGNSGGALLNVRGQLIGVNTAIRADAQNIGFAIPVDTLTRELPSLMDFERLHRVVFGAQVAGRHGTAGDEVLVQSVTPGTPAAGALKPGDRLVSVNGSPIRQMPDYCCAMMELPAEAAVELGVSRAGKTLTVKIALKARPKPDGQALARKLMGLTLRAVTPEMAQSMHLPMAQGLLVTAVVPGGPAAQIGAQVGDVLFEIDGLRVGDLDAAAHALEDVPAGKRIRIGVARGNVRAWVSLQAGAAPAKEPERGDGGSV
ncbi:MAG: trypsin-like peptidase domain-containing protein [Planctomycetota bacterium]|nr:trypsin-like peptidase domain-containing protein [Planctomycetota bacterium]